MYGSNAEGIRGAARTARTRPLAAVVGVGIAVDEVTALDELMASQKIKCKGVKTHFASSLTVS